MSYVETRIDKAEAHVVDLKMVVEKAKNKSHVCHSILYQGEF
jgi:hypothetical protein